MNLSRAGFIKITALSPLIVTKNEAGGVRWYVSFLGLHDIRHAKMVYYTNVKLTSKHPSTIRNLSH